MSTIVSWFSRMVDFNREEFLRLHEVERRRKVEETDILDSMVQSQSVADSLRDSSHSICTRLLCIANDRCLLHRCLSSDWILPMPR